MESRYLEIYGKNVHVVQDLISEAMEQGIVRKMDPAALADTLGDMLVGLAYMGGVRGRRESLTKNWNIIEQIIQGGILAP